MQTNITHTRGDTYSFPFQMMNIDNTPVDDLVSGNFLFTIKKKFSDVASLVEVNGNIVNQANGEAEILIDSNILDLDLGTYYYHLKYFDNSGQEFTMQKGFFTLTFNLN